MYINAIKCSKCGDIIYSRARHDCRHCSCGSIFIDGGFNYIRIGGKGISGKELNKIKTFKIEVNATKKELYDDWNNLTDKYGLIKSPLKKVRTYFDEFYSKLSFKDKLAFNFWYIFYSISIRISMFLRRLTYKIDKI